MKRPINLDADYGSIVLKEGELFNPNDVCFALKAFSDLSEKEQRIFLRFLMQVTELSITTIIDDIKTRKHFK